MTELEVGLAQHLHGVGIGTFMTSTPASRTIFIGELPEDVTEGVMLIPVPSPPPHQYVDTEYQIIDFWARSNHSDRAKTLLRNINEEFHRKYHYDVDDWHIYFSQALGSIIDVDRDREGGKLYRLSVQFICRNLNHIS